MKRPKNRMAEVEMPEDAPARPVVRTKKQCPLCGTVGLVISEMRRNNRIIRERRCEKCNTRWTGEE